VNHAEAPSLPWSLSDARTMSLTTAIGAVLLAWSWWQASGTARMSSQVGWLTVAVFAAVVMTAGAFSWIWAGRRAVRVRRVLFVDTLSTDLLGDVGAAIEVDSDPTSVPVGIAGSDRYHRDDCLLVRGKAVQALAGTDGRLACEMCRP
jgi:hypothetical protein